MYKAKQYLPILAGMFCILLILIGKAASDLREPIRQVRFSDSIQGHTLEPYYEEEEDRYYLFLPSYLEPEQVRVECSRGTEVRLQDGRKVSALGDLKGRDAAKLQISHLAFSKEYTFEIMQCKNLPALFLDMQPEALGWINGDKDRQEHALAQFVDQTGSVMFQNIGQISGRGNGSWNEGVKRPYNLSFSDPVSVGPFEEVTTLCLIADYSDESKMRNAIAYHCGEALGIPYASAYMQVDVYVNGAYLGLYGVCTKQEYTKNIASDQIQAVFEITSNKTGQYFETEELKRAIRVMYGSTHAIEEKANELEQALVRQDWETCSRILDLESVARKYILDEFLGNVDMGYASQYFYIGSDGRICSMLPWDYDWSLGSAITFFNRDHAYGLMSVRSSRYWGTKLLAWDSFCQEVRRLLEEEYTDEFLRDLQTYTWDLENAIGSSRDCDTQRWKYSDPYGQGVAGFDSLSELTQFFCTYYPQRRDHLLRYFSAPEDFCLVEFRHTESSYYLSYLIPRGEGLFDYVQDREKLAGVYDGYEILNWHTTDGAPLEQLNVITQDTILYPELTEVEECWEKFQPDEGTAIEKIMERKEEILIYGLFGLAALILFGIQLGCLLRKERVMP